MIIEREVPRVTKGMLGISFLICLFSLWLINMQQISHKHIAEFYYFWDNYIETGRKLLKNIK